MGRPKGSKNKPKVATLDAIVEEPRETVSGAGKKYWGNKIYLIVETPKKSEPRLHSYTESETGARSMVKLMADTRPSSKFHVVEREVDWSKPVNLL